MLENTESVELDSMENNFDKNKSVKSVIKDMKIDFQKRSSANYVSLIRYIDNAFEISERETTILIEITCGYIHFISCLFVLPVIPDQMEAAGYNKTSSIEATALACCVGCIISSYLTNLPFIIAPPTAVSIFLAVALQRGGMTQSQGDTAVILSGMVLVVIGIFKPLTKFVSKLIPDCIQAATAVGIGLITALAGAIELKLVVPGKYTILEMGAMSPSIGYFYQ